MRERDRRVQPRRQEAPERAAGKPPVGTDAVLALQRSAGNAAVARALIGGHRKPRKPPPRIGGHRPAKPPPNAYDLYPASPTAASQTSISIEPSAPEGWGACEEPPAPREAATTVYAKPPSPRQATATQATAVYSEPPRAVAQPEAEKATIPYTDPVATQPVAESEEPTIPYTEPTLPARIDPERVANAHKPLVAHGVYEEDTVVVATPQRVDQAVGRDGAVADALQSTEPTHELLQIGEQVANRIARPVYPEMLQRQAIYDDESKDSDFFIKAALTTAAELLVAKAVPSMEEALKTKFGWTDDDIRKMTIAASSSSTGSARSRRRPTAGPRWRCCSRA